MKYLIDTDIASYYLRGKFNLREIFIKAGLENIILSIITVAQMRVLAHKRSTSVINFSRIEEMAKLTGVINTDTQTWNIYSELKARTQLNGKERGDLDILQASLAKQHDLILVTHNRRHFEGLINCEDWSV